MPAPHERDRDGTAGWWLAAVATVLTGVLLVLAGASLVAPTLLAVGAVTVTLVRRRHATS